jgi:hypothetical protein
LIAESERFARHRDGKYTREHQPGGKKHSVHAAAASCVRACVLRACVSMRGVEDKKARSLRSC